MDTMHNLGFFPEIVPRGANKIEMINTARRKFSLMAFDEDACKKGINHLRLYRKEWDDKYGVFRNIPAHNEHSHGADALMTYTSSQHTALPRPLDSRDNRYSRFGRSRSSGGSHMAA